jgi:ribosomal protein L16/L10AE
MSIPKKTKYRFQHQPRYFKGGKNDCHYLLAKGNKEIKKGNKYGLQSQQGAEIKERQIKAIYNIVSKNTKKLAVGKHKP